MHIPTKKLLTPYYTAAYRYIGSWDIALILLHIPYKNSFPPPGHPDRGNIMLNKTAATYSPTVTQYHRRGRA